MPLAPFCHLQAWDHILALELIFIAYHHSHSPSTSYKQLKRLHSLRAHLICKRTICDRRTTEVSKRERFALCLFIASFIESFLFLYYVDVWVLFNSFDWSPFYPYTSIFTLSSVSLTSTTSTQNVTLVYPKLINWDQQGSLVIDVFQNDEALAEFMELREGIPLGDHKAGFVMELEPTAYFGENAKSSILRCHSWVFTFGYVLCFYYFVIRRCHSVVFT